jgi:hypothetical protein
VSDSRVKPYEVRPVANGYMVLPAMGWNHGGRPVDSEEVYVFSTEAQVADWLRAQLSADKAKP